MRLHGDEEARIRGRMDFIRRTCRFASDHQYIVRHEGKACVCFGGFGGEENEALAAGGAPVFKSTPRSMACDLDLIKIIHACPTEMPVADGKTCGFDDCSPDAKAGAHAQHSPAILGDIGLEEGKGEGHGSCLAPAGGLAKCLVWLSGLTLWTSKRNGAK